MEPSQREDDPFRYMISWKDFSNQLEIEKGRIETIILLPNTRLIPGRLQRISMTNEILGYENMVCVSNRKV